MNPGVISVQCPNCHAKLAYCEGKSTYVCDYCGHQFRFVEQSPIAAPPPVQSSAPSQIVVPSVPTATQGAAPQPKKTGATCLLVVIVFLAIVIGGVIFMVQGSGPLGLFERLIWDDVGGPPMVVEIDGSEAFVGRIRSVSNNHQLSVVVVDSATCDVRWRTKDLGTYSQGLQNVRYAPAGDRVWVSDSKATLHVHEIRTGKLVNSFQMSDQVQQICPVTGTTSVWVKVVDDQNVMLDLASGVVQLSAPPPGCPLNFSNRDDMLTGVANGRTISIYGSGESGWRLRASDTATGRGLWDVELRAVSPVDSINDLVVSSRFVYIARTRSIEVHDAATGNLVDTIGSENYRVF